MGTESEVVREDETICAISHYSRDEEHAVEAPFTRLIVGALENPVTLPGHPIRHLVRIRSETREERAEIRRGEFDGHRSYSQRRMADDEEAE